MRLRNIFHNFSFRSPRNWKLERQKDPPFFGYAQLVGSKTLEREVQKRKLMCIDILNDQEQYCSIKKNKISLIVLTCKRWETLKRITESLAFNFDKIESYPDIERILVDNNSGDEIINRVKGYQFYDNIISFNQNCGLLGALRDVYKKVDGEYILLLEDDFVFDYDQPFLQKCINVFQDYPEIGLVRLKNQNNWWKPHRVIAPVRQTAAGVEFWTWLPSKNGELNGWCSGSVLFRKASYFSTGELPYMKKNPPRSKRNHQGYVYEQEYGKKYNKIWLTAKLKNVYPFFQPNDNAYCLGWDE